MITACALRGWKVEHDLSADTYRIVNMRTREHTDVFPDLEALQGWMQKNLENRLAEALYDMAKNI